MARGKKRVRSWTPDPRKFAVAPAPPDNSPDPSYRQSKKRKLAIGFQPPGAWSAHVTPPAPIRKS